MTLIPFVLELAFFRTPYQQKLIYWRSEAKSGKLKNVLIKYVKSEPFCQASIPIC